MKGCGNMKRITGLLKNRGFVIAVITSAIICVSCFAAVRWNTATSGAKLAGKSAIAVSVSFDRLNDIMRQLEGIAAENRDFFRDENAFDRYDDRFLEIVNATKNIRSFCPFVEEVVLYQRDSQRMITTAGSISKDEFFKYAYETDTVDTGYWNSVMEIYNTPTIIPVHKYTVLSYPESTKKLFVVPKIFSLYKIGVLIFVNEQMFTKIRTPIL